MRRKILFLCTGNSARSQMAEALVNHLRGEEWEAMSAGTHPTGYIHPFAIAAMKEIGVDISAARSKPLEEFRDKDFDLVVTVCDDAAEECPVWLGQGTRANVGFPDPAGEPFEKFRELRDEIYRRIIPLLSKKQPPKSSSSRRSLSRQRARPPIKYHKSTNAPAPSGEHEQTNEKYFAETSSAEPHASGRVRNAWRAAQR